MPDQYLVTERAVLSPTCCFRCNGFRGPFVDFGLDMPAWGNLYLCFSCADQLARIMGYASPEKVESYEAQIREMVEETDRLGEELEAERGNKVVTLAEVMPLLKSTHAPTSRATTKAGK